MKRIGVITSGGDCGGLNAVIKGAAQMALRNGIEIVIIPNGYAGLYNLIQFKELVTLTPQRVDFIDSNLAGSEAGHSRVKIKKIKDEQKYQRIQQGLEKFQIDGLVISGGDDTGSVMVDLASHGIACVQAPKTMDLDLQPYSVGGDSTINRISQFVVDLKTTGKTHNRIIVVEVFGRYAGHTAFRGGLGADADCILIPEVPVDMDIVYEHMKKVYMGRIEKSDVKSGTYTIVVAEGLKDINGKGIYDESAGLDTFGHKKLAGAGKYVCQQVEKRMKQDAELRQFMENTGMFVQDLYEIPEIRDVRPGHLVRCGQTSAFDVSFGREAGAAAVILLKQGLSGVTVVDVKGHQVRYMKTQDAIVPRYVDLSVVEFYESLGVCFGRPSKKDFKAECVEITEIVDRHY
ncbi:6-phosphofructokinase [PVC group bacterium]|nr:6-phosphofructokinase [PVC group bacterium]